MPIIIAGSFDFAPAIAEQLILDAETLIADALAEPGCRAYNWALDPLAPGRVHVFELWDDEPSLAHHFASGPYKLMGAHVTAAGFTNMNVAKYRTDLSEPVYDPAGVARADFFTETV